MNVEIGLLDLFHSPTHCRPHLPQPNTELRVPGRHIETRNERRVPAQRLSLHAVVVTITRHGQTRARQRPIVSILDGNTRSDHIICYLEYMLEGASGAGFRGRRNSLGIQQQLDSLIGCEMRVERELDCCLLADNIGISFVGGVEVWICVQQYACPGWKVPSAGLL